MKRLLALAFATLLGCTEGPFPDANDAQALAAVRECAIRTPWFFGPIFGLDIDHSVALWLRGLERQAFDEAASCLRRSLRRQSAGAAIEDWDAPGKPTELVDVNTGERVLVPPPDVAEPVWRDMNGRPIQPRR